MTKSKKSEESKYCKFCDTNHPLTGDFWYFKHNSETECKIKSKIKGMARYNHNKERILRRQKERNNTKKDQKKAYDQKYFQENKTRLLQIKAKYRRERRKTDICFKICDNLRRRLNRSIKNKSKGGRFVEEVGCTIDQLKLHLESQFKSGMSWDNYGYHGWHIDHIIPLSSFDLTDREQFSKACHYTNLQPLWAKENLQKSDKH